MRIKIALIAIFALALFFRIFSLSEIPKDLHIDELYVGYSGYNLIRTGNDIFGNKLPLYIDKFGDHRPAGIFYLEGIFTLLLPLSTFSIRLPVAILGAATIFSVYFLTKQVFRNQAVSIFSCLLLAISPWHIVASRSTSESVVALFLTVTGMAFVLRAINGRQKLVIVALTLFIISYFFYHTPRIFIPLFMIFTAPFFLTFIKAKNDQWRFKLLVSIVVVLSFILVFTSFGAGRFSQVSLFTSDELVKKIQVLQDGDQGNILMARIFHNKIVVASKELVNQYLTYFSPQFLYMLGGLPARYAVPDLGLLYYGELLLFIVGLVLLVKKKEKLWFLPIVWLLCGPIAAAITLEDSPNMQRAIFMLPAFQIIEAYGLTTIVTTDAIKNVIKKAFVVVLSLIFLFNIVYAIHQYFVHSTFFQAFGRSNKNDVLFLVLFQKEKLYDKIYLPVYQDLPVYFYYFRYFHERSVQLPTLSREQLREGFAEGKYIFVKEACPERILQKSDVGEGEKILVIDFGECQEYDDARVKVKTTQIITREDSTAAYILKDNLQ